MSLVRPFVLCLLLPLATQAHAGRPKLKKLDVASLSVEAPAGVCAGAETQLTGVATLSDGTILRSRTVDGGKGELRPADLVLKAEPKVDGHDRVFVENTGTHLVGTALTVTVTGRGTDLQAATQLPVHFRCTVPLDYTAEGTAGAPWTAPKAETRDPKKVGLDDVGQVFLPAAMLAQAARDVKEARPLLAGAPGGSGESGTGLSGADGGPGQPGSHGHDLVVELVPHDGLVLARIHDATESQAREVVIDPAGGELHLVTRGGRGGKGGRGGNGGQGVTGVEKGGPGGHGGRGGDGGVGGRGGHVTVRIPANQPGWAQLVTVDAAGGPGGDGGRGGDGAWGGDGEHRGDMGEDGGWGRSGDAGPAGEVRIEPL